MTNIFFCLGMAALLMPLVLWACRVLPREKWQILASIPSGEKAGPSGSWPGTNLTIYGFLFATGSLMGVTVFLFLLAAVAIPISVILTLIGLVMTLALGGAKVIARLVEKKRNTLTVAGGASVGLYFMPLAIFCYNNLQGDPADFLPLMPVMAALAIAYCIGEGIGRLACISFGCCYGKPLSELGPLTKKIFSRFHVTFYGKTKKIVYASGLAGVKVVPIQAITSFLHVTFGILGMYFFLEGLYTLAFGSSALFAMGWRIVSEQLRADYRGAGKLSAYQWMGICNILCCLLLLGFSPQISGRATDLSGAARALWNPGVILFFQLLWAVFFFYTGLSKVTGASLIFFVRRNNI